MNPSATKMKNPRAPAPNLDLQNSPSPMAEFRRKREPSRSRSPLPASKSRSKNGRRASRSPSLDPRSHDVAHSRSHGRYRSRSRSKSHTPPLTESRSPSPITRSRSRSPGRDDVGNPGNTLFVTGLSTRVTERDLKHHLSKEGKVVDSYLVVQPHTRVSRGFAFVTMDTVEDADHCIKYLNQSILDGRKITIEKSRRKRPRTPTPGGYKGFRNPNHLRDRYSSRYRDDYYRDRYSRYDRRSPYRVSRGYSPRRSRSRSWSRSPYSRR